jgi:hypothetical protein
MAFILGVVHLGYMELIMHSKEEYNQAMLENQQMLEDALVRAESGIATAEDWNIIRYECGVPSQPKVTLETISITRSE